MKDNPEFRKRLRAQFKRWMDAQDRLEDLSGQVRSYEAALVSFFQNRTKLVPTIKQNLWNVCEKSPTDFHILVQDPNKGSKRCFFCEPELEFKRCSAVLKNTFIRCDLKVNHDGNHYSEKYHNQSEWR